MEIQGKLMTLGGTEGIFISRKWFDLMSMIYDIKVKDNPDRKEYFQGKHDLMQDCFNYFDTLKEIQQRNLEWTRTYSFCEAHCYWKHQNCDNKPCELLKEYINSKQGLREYYKDIL